MHAVVHALHVLPADTERVNACQWQCIDDRVPCSSITARPATSMPWTCTKTHSCSLRFCHCTWQAHRWKCGPPVRAALSFRHLLSQKGARDSVNGCLEALQTCPLSSLFCCMSQSACSRCTAQAGHTGRSHQQACSGCRRPMHGCWSTLHVPRALVRTSPPPALPSHQTCSASASCDHMKLRQHLDGGPQMHVTSAHCC
jgi:hypothetical protein